MEKICPVCNKTFNTFPCMNKIYCSNECYHKIQKGRPGYKRSLETLNKLSNSLKQSKKAKQFWFKKGKDNIAFGKNQMSENNNNWTGGQHNYAHVFALRKKEKKCEVCGKTTFKGKQLHVHHIDENEKNNDIENLQVLCASCHMKEHIRRNKI